MWCLLGNLSSSAIRGTYLNGVCVTHCSDVFTLVPDFGFSVANIDHE